MFRSARSKIAQVKMGRSLLFLLSLAMLMNTGCSSDEKLVGVKNFAAAAEIITVLRSSGISADARELSRDPDNNKYDIYISNSDYGAAIRVLDEYHLPKGSEDLSALTALTAPEGFMPNPRELFNMRLDRALGFEVERLLSSFPGIVEVRAIIRSNLLQSDSDGNAVKRPPTASIMLRYDARSGNQPFSTDEAKRVVIKAIPGLAVEDVNITTSRVIVPGSEGLGSGIDTGGNSVQLARVAPFSFQVPATEKDRVRMLIAGMLLMFVIAGFVIGYFISRIFRPTKPSAPRTVRTAMLEASFKAPGAPGGSLPAKGTTPRGSIEQ